MPRPPIFDIDRIDMDHVVADIESIRGWNPQRHEFEQLSRICHFDTEAREVAGVLEIPAEPWWARGHVPEQPLMPGVLMLEAAAQLCSWAVHQVMEGREGHIFGFGGIDGVKFRGAVLPPSDLLVVGKALEIRTRRAAFQTQGYCDGGMVFEARITGLWVPVG